MLKECNRKNMKLFIAALKNGEYRQGIGALRQLNKKYFNSLDFESTLKTYTYCCLGVACEVYRVSEKSQEKWLQGNSNAYHFHGGGIATLPNPVFKWLGINEGNPVLDIPESLQEKAEGNIAKATTLNDSRRFTFDEIAACFKYTYLAKEQS